MTFIDKASIVISIISVVINVAGWLIYGFPKPRSKAQHAKAMRREADRTRFLTARWQDGS